MTGKQKLFVDYYVGEARGNAAKAADLAGYTSPKQEGYRLKANGEVAGAIAEKLRERTLSSEEILERLTQHADGSMGLFVKSVHGEIFFDLESEAAQSNLHLIKRIKTKKKSFSGKESSSEETEIEVELYDAQSALRDLGRHHKLFVDRVEQKVTAESVVGYTITPPGGSGDLDAGAPD